MTVVNPRSISGINSITMASGSDNLLTIHTTNTTERVRVNSDGDVIVGSGITVSPDGDIFATGVTTSTTFVGNLTGNVTGNISGGTVAGSTGTFTSHVSLGDSDELRLGDATGGDLKIYHDGNNSAINDVGTGSLYIQGSDNIFFRDYDTSENHIVMTKNGAVDLYHNGTIKLSTTSAGVTIQNGHLALNRQDTSNEGGEIVFNRASDNANQWFNDVYGNDSTAKIRWHHGGAEKIAFSTGGDLNIIDGNLHVASGHGIDFSATTDGSGMTSELLSDYEEGTYTPTDGSGQSISFSNAEGLYTRVGNLVHVQGSVTFPSTGGQFGFAITLPFTGTSSGRTAGGGDVRYTTKSTVFNLHLNASTSNFGAYAFGGTLQRNADLSTDRLDFQLTYRIA